MVNGWGRAAATLLGAAAAGFLLWLAAQIGRHTTGGYWAAYGIVAAAGVVFALSQLRGRTGHPPGMLLFGFLPVLIVAGWVLVSLEPHGNSFRSHVLAWSGDLHIRGIVNDLGTWLGVLAFGIGFTLGAALEPAPRREVVVDDTRGETVRGDRYDAADEPVTAERREYPSGNVVPGHREVPVDEAPADDTTQVDTRRSVPR